MSTSFDNLVSRKGSPANSFRSGITNASNMSSETRDLSRQSAQQARHNHRRAIQARKIVFLVLILLLILGGLSYAIYRVVSNDSDDTESTKVKLENDEKTSIQSLKTSSLVEEQIKTSTLHETKRTPILSKLKSIRTTHHVSVTSTISTLKPAAQEQKTSSVLSVMGTHSLQSTKKQTNSYATVEKAQSSSEKSSKLAGVQTTKTTETGVQSTSNTLPTSQMNEYSSPETKNMPTSNHPVQVTASSMFHNFKTTSKGKSMTSTSSLDTQIGPSHSTATTIIQHSLEITPKLNSSAVVSTISANALPSQTTKLPSLNKSHTTEHSTSNRISTSINHHASSRMLTPAMSSSGASASINVNTSDMTTAKIKPTKTSITPVVSSSEGIPPYYHQWSNWSKCSRDCGGGYTYQTRNCSQHGQCDVLGPGINTTICNLYKCNETTFNVSLNLTDFQWNDDFHNMSSAAYADLVQKLMKELRALYGPNVSITIDNVSEGSVIVWFTITFPSSNQIINLTNAINGGKIGNLSVSLVMLVNNMVPEAPENVSVHNITTNSTIIHWSPIKSDKANGILQGYEVILSPGNFSWTVRGEEITTVAVKNLNPDTQYTVSVLGLNINGEGERKSKTFKTKELPPHFLPWGDWGNCSRDCGGGVTSRNRSCSKDNMCSHLGEYEQKEYCNVEKCNETSFDVGLNMTNVDWTDDLYNTSSAAYQELLAKFLEELRKKYPNATIDIGSITKGSVLFHFTITFPEETETDAESFSNDLEENGLGNYTTEVKDVVDNNLPSVPPGAINVTMVTTQSAYINWLPISEENSNGAILGYKIILTSGHNNTMDFDIATEASDNEFSYQLNMLAPNTTYRFYVYGYNINGDGPESELSYFTTKVQIPKIYSANITHVTTTHAQFSWQMINDNNETYGVITGYKVFITHNHQPRLDLEVPSVLTKVHLNDLLPNTSYGVLVFGYNHYGDGMISDMFNFTTRVQIPKVLFGNITHVTRTSGVLSWKKVPDSEESYGIISGYMIFINSEDEHSRNLTVSRNESEIQLRDLHSGTSYNLTIIGFNSFGKGMISDIIEFKTRDLIPKPNFVMASNITFTTAKLSWGLIPPNENTYGTIDGYKVTIRHGLLVNTTIVREMTSIVIRNISSNSTYCFHVVAFNHFGDGVDSDQECFTTAVEEEMDELKTSTAVVSKSSQSHPPTVSVPHTTEKAMVKSSSVNTKVENSETMSAKTANLLATSTATSVIVHQNASSSMISQFTRQRMQASSSSIPISSTRKLSSTLTSSVISSSTPTPTPTSSPTSTLVLNAIFTVTSHVNEVISTNTKAIDALTSTVQPSSSTKETTTQTSTPTTAFTESSSQPTTASTSVSSTAGSEPTLSTSPPLEFHVGKIRLTGQTFNSELSNTESQVYKELASKLEKMLEDLFRADGLELESVKVLGFSEGSVVVNFYVITRKSLEYQESNFTVVLEQAVTNGSGLQGQPFDFNPNDFSTMNTKPTLEPIGNEADKGLQKNTEEDDSALIVAVVLCVLLVIGIAIVVVYIGKKKNWFRRGKRKVVPEDDDDDDDDMYPSPTQDTVRLKTARAGRRSHGARINGGHSTTEC